MHRELGHNKPSADTGLEAPAGGLNEQLVELRGPQDAEVPFLRRSLAALEVHQLENGLELLVLPVEGEQNVSIHFGVHAGSRFENPSNAGISHIAEELVVQDLFRDLSSGGSTLRARADTDFELTQYCWSGVPEFAPEYLQRISRALSKHTVAEDVFELVRNGALNEYHARRDDPSAHCPFLLNTALYGRSPLSRPVEGRDQSLAAMTAHAAEQFLDDFHRPSNATVVLTGAISPKLVEAAKELLSEAQGGERSSVPLLAPLSQELGERVSVRTLNTGLSYVMPGIAIEGYRDPDYAQLALLSGFLVATNSSPLSAGMIHSSNLSYKASAQVKPYGAEHGAFVLYFEPQRERLLPAIDRCFDVLKRIECGEFDADLFKNQRDLIAARVLQTSSSSALQADSLLRQRIFGSQIDSIEEGVAVLLDTEPSHVSELVARRFSPDQLCFGVVGGASRGSILGHLELQVPSD